jgi:hypothetical protein
MSGVTAGMCSQKPLETPSHSLLPTPPKKMLFLKELPSQSPANLPEKSVKESLPFWKEQAQVWSSAKFPAGSGFEITAERKSTPQWCCLEQHGRWTLPEQEYTSCLPLSLGMVFAHLTLPPALQEELWIAALSETRKLLAPPGDFASQGDIIS